MTTPLEQLLGDAGRPPTWTPAGAVRFSVIVRTQGRRPTSLVAALESIAEQPHRAHEVLVVVHEPDPSTADRVRDQLEAADLGLPLVVLAIAEGGRSRPLNVGLDHATGDYVCFLDDDDLALPDWLGAFDRAIRAAPGTTPRARTGVQPWATDGGEEPLRPLGRVEEPFATEFDLLGHCSQNQTPICAVAFPRHVLEHFSFRFAEDLPVFEDWEFLMRVAPLTGVTSINAQTQLYRRLDHGNADTAEDPEVWAHTHAVVVARIAERPLLAPAGDAQRIATAHFQIGGGSRHEAELLDAYRDLDELTRSPLRWSGRFVRRVGGAVRGRIAGPPR
ncbi:MAG: glycosyltransferase family A protein [Myxococcota bacterium]